MLDAAKAILGFGMHGMITTNKQYIIYILGLLLLSFSEIAQAQERKALPVTNINSEFDELMPVVAPDGKTLYFVRTGHPENIGGANAGQDIWYSQKNIEDNEWQPPLNSGAPLNNIYNNAINSLSPDGQQVWLNNVYLPRNRMAPGLSYADKTSTGWAKPQAVTIQNFTPETGFLNCYQATDSILFLSVQTDTTYLEDIFICRRVGEKEWSVPKRLNNINTTGFEIAPVLAPDGRTLYFTSNGHGGFGDADILVSRRLDNTWLNWSEPVNLGAAVNTAGFDGYFTLDTNNGMAYFTRENEEENTDIYFIRLEEIAPASENITAALPAKAEPLPNTQLVIESDRTELNLPVLVFFEVNSVQLNPQAETTLQTLKEQLASSEKTLVIQGHADDTGTEPTNKILSEKRAKAVAAYLVLQGLPAASIRIQGFGSSQPVVPNQSARNRAKNRRVEIQIE
ncbi:OmpA family protein [Adhaeribacter rhizoryzae]|uniref:OmpA family protein n=1 Tax=Adhaeribacter rhizoryzae TaxID=2607907 RepID=A0A5M6CUA9_9BACT|nr:OmpA family protein [Adhaeribacter rhizoryzae]KAA5538781.1 OmpA family protein [Adhaeribacter rhizoryzae]